MSVARQKKPVNPARRGLLAKIHIAKKELGLSDDIYRDCIEAIVPGIRSASDLSIPDLENLLKHFKARGWTGKVKRKPGSKRRTTSSRPMIRKIYVLWDILYRNGKAKSKRPDAWVARMTKRPSQPDGVGNVEWLEDNQAWSIIESLKKWIIREGLEGDLER